MTTPSRTSHQKLTRPPTTGRRSWRVLAGTVRFAGRLLRGLIAATVLGALVVGLPWALWHYIGWPLPDHIPTWVEFEGVLLGPMTTTFLLDILACLCWIAWAAFTIDVVRCTVDVVRGLARDGVNATRLPTFSGTDPVHALAGVLVGAVLVSVLGNRPPPAPAASPIAAFAAGTGVVATAPAWHTPQHSDDASVQGTVYDAVFVTRFVNQTSAHVPAAGREPAPPRSVVVRAPENGVHDSLWRIAARTLGDGARWPEIFELNKGKTQPYGHRLTSPSLIFPGEELTLPADATTPPPPPDSSPPPAPPEPPTTPPPTTAPPTSAQPSTPETPAPSTQQTPEQAPEQAPPTATGTNSQPPATREPGVGWGPELFVGLGLAAAVSAALLIARRRFNSRYRPGSGDRDELPVAPVVYQLRLAHLRTEAEDTELHLDGDDDREGQRPERVPPSPPLVVGSPEPGTGIGPGERSALAAGLGVRDGREIALDLATARGLGLVGDGAPAAARALLVAALSAYAQHSATTSPPATSPLAGACVFVPADDLVRVLGRGAAQVRLPAAVRVVANLDDALDALEAETLVRAAASSEQHTAPRTWPALVLMAQPSEHQRRLQAVLDNGAPFGITGLLLGQWQPGVTVYVRADGTISATSPGLGEALRGTRMFRLGDNDTTELLTLLRQAEPTTTAETPPEAPPDGTSASPRPRSRIVPAEPAENHRAMLSETEPSAPGHADDGNAGESGQSGAAAGGAEPESDTELEVTAAVPAPGSADTDLEILGSNRAAAPSARVRPPTVPRRQPTAPHVPEDATIANDVCDHPAPTGEHTTVAPEPTPGATAVGQNDVTAGATLDPTAGTVPAPITITVLGALRVHWNPTPSTNNSAVLTATGSVTDPVTGSVTDSDRQGWEITGALQPRARELLVLLALYPDGVTREALVSALWGQDPPTRPTNALHTALSRMRSAVAAATHDVVTDIVVVANGRYQLDPAKVLVDYWRFTKAVTARRAASTDHARVDAYREVVNSYGGPLAEGMAAEWIEPAREAIRRDAIDAVAALARALVASDPQQTLDLLEVARAFDPHNELLYRDIMRLQERLGQLDAIPRTLTLLTTRLAEVDETPTPQARSLAARLGQRHHEHQHARHDDASTAAPRSVTTREPRRSAAS